MMTAQECDTFSESALAWNMNVPLPFVKITGDCQKALCFVKSGAYDRVQLSLQSAIGSSASLANFALQLDDHPVWERPCATIGRATRLLIANLSETLQLARRRLPYEMLEYRIDDVVTKAGLLIQEAGQDLRASQIADGVDPTHIWTTDQVLQRLAGHC